MKFSGKDGYDTRNNVENLWVIYIKPLDTMFLFYIYSRTDMKQPIICSIFGVLQLTPWIQGRIFFILWIRVC